MTGARQATRRGRLIAVVGLVVSLAGWGWFASEQARTSWWVFGQHVAVGPDDQGWASIDALSVRLAGAEMVPEVEEEQAPAGFAYLVVDLEVETRAEGPETTASETTTSETTGTDAAATGGSGADTSEEAATQPLSSCDVEVRDARGRLFEAGREVPRADPFVTSLRCGTSDPGEDPVPTDQSLVVLVPTDAELSSVRVVAREFPPARFIELPLAP